MAMLEQLDAELDLDEADLLSAMIIVAIRPDPVNMPGNVQYRHFGTDHAFHEVVGMLQAVLLGVIGRAAGPQS
jgi:hypothetical protein